MNQASVEIQSLAAWLSTEEHRVQLGVWQFDGTHRVQLEHIVCGSVNISCST